MILLIDYDNILPLDRKKGLVYVVERAMRSIGVNAFSGRRASVRLYGGWFENSKISRSAQSLAPQVQADFPRPIVITDSTKSITVLTRIELAAGLACDLSTRFTHTYRTRTAPANLNASPPPYSGCKFRGSCALSSIHSFIASRHCPHSGCTVKLTDVLTRSEQKLVDTLIVSDLIHYADNTTEPIAIVSTDDDLWPGIHSALVRGASVHHVHPSPVRRTPTHYSKYASGNYAEYNF